MIRKLRMNLLLMRQSVNVWLWRKGWGTRKQKYNVEELPPIAYEVYKQPRIGRYYFIAGLVIGYIPYIVHMNQWLK